MSADGAARRPYPRRYFTRTFFRKNVGTSRSCPSTIVGSLFSKRPRVTGSNCSTSCFACAFFSFGVFTGASSGGGGGNFAGNGFFFGTIKRGAGVEIKGSAGSSIGKGD